MRVVLDTNVLVSGMLGFTRAGSVPGELLRRWRAEVFHLVTSQHILTELERSLTNRWIQERISPETHTYVLTRLRTAAELVAVETMPLGLELEPADKLVVATAIQGEADYLVSGDRALVELGRHRHITIINPRSFMNMLDLLS